MTVTPQSQDRLREIRERLASGRSSANKARAAVDAARSAQDAHAEATATLVLDRAAHDVRLGEELERAILRQVAGISGGGYGFDESFLDDPERVAQLERLASTSQKFDRVELGALSSVATLVAQINSGAWGQPKMAASVVPDSTVGRRGPFSELGVVQQPRRRLRLLDLVPTSPAVGNSIPFVVESGLLDTAAETSEGALKPTGDIGLTDQEAPIRTIAHWIKAPRQVLADVPGLPLLLQNRLSYVCLRHFETQLVGGDGTGQNLRGILNTTGVGNIAYTAGTPLGDLSLAGLVAVLNSEGEPDACVMNATTLSSLLTPKASTSGMYLNIDSPFGTGPQDLSLWGIPVVISTMMPNNQVLFGSFANGAHLWIRESVNVIIGMESDDMTRNLVTILGEMRAGITINIPSFFTLVHLA